MYRYGHRQEQRKERLMYRWRIYLRNGGQRIIFSATKPHVQDATYVIKER